MKRKIISLLLIFAFVLTSCKNNQDNVNQSEDNQKETTQNIATQDNTDEEYEKYTDTFFDVFDTIISFTAYTQSKEEYEYYINDVEAQTRSKEPTPIPIWGNWCGPGYGSGGGGPEGDGRRDCPSWRCREP